MTHRQFVAFERWLADERDEPTPEQFYLMQVACEVRRGYAKHPRQVKMKDFRLRFGRPKPVGHTKESVELSKQVWLQRMSMKPVVVKEDPQGPGDSPHVGLRDPEGEE